MKSSGSRELLDLERDLPTTAEDTAALRRLREMTRLTFDEYFRFLAEFEPPPAEALRSRRGPRGDRLFEVF
jgi:hypothetical protein